MKGRLRILLFIFVLLAAAAAGFFARGMLPEKPVAKGAVSTAAQTPPQDALSRFRTQREQFRARQTAQLNDILHDEATDAQTLSQAQNLLIASLQEEAQEITLEGLLGAKGFEGVLVSISGGCANVLVRGEPLNARQSAVILDAVMRQTGITGGNVKIIPLN